MTVHREQNMKREDQQDATIRYLFYFCVSVHRSISQMKHQLDATLYRFYFCRVTLHVSGVKRPSSGVFKTGTVATGTCVIVAGKSSHLLIRAETALIRDVMTYLQR